MIQFREIDLSEALRMIENDDLDNLYFKVSSKAIDCVKDYKIDFDELTKKTYFKREEVK